MFAARSTNAVSNASVSAIVGVDMFAFSVNTGI